MPSLELTDYFDEIVVINLPERTDRRRDMEQQFKRIGLSYPHERITFFSAVRPADKGGFPSVGARGCFLSHLAVIDEASRRGSSRILICEDDLTFASDFRSRIGGILAELSAKDWAIFYGGYSSHAALTPERDQSCVAIPPAHPIRTTHFLALQGECIAALSRYLRGILERPPGDPRGGPMHVDGAYSHFRRDCPQYQTLVATPELGYQRSSRSDIYPNRWYDCPPFSAIGYYARMVKQIVR